MLFSLLPTTALAAYPDDVGVYNNAGSRISLSNGECLAANDATGASSYTSGSSSYVARYDKSTGTLYLKDYHGVATERGIGVLSDLNIEVVSDSSFTTSATTTNDLSGIQADGKLKISGSGKLTVTATGSGNVYGIYAGKGVTISAPLDVRVGERNTTDNGTVYGIYTKSGAISLSGNDMTVNATGGGTSIVYGVFNAAETETPAIADNGNIGISGKLTVNLSNGSINRGISSQGGDITLNGATVKIPGNYYYGIFNINGNVDIKSNSDVDISSDISGNNGICTYSGGDLTIENSTVKVSAKGPAAKLKGNVSIKDSDVDLTRNAEEYLVVNSAENAENTINLSTEGSVTLTASGEQTNYAMITGKVTLGANTKREKGKPNGNSYDGAYDGSSKTVLKFVHESTTPTATVGDVTIGGVKDSPITNQEVTITLTNDTFESTLSGDWITNLPNGLNQSVGKTDATHAKITVSGTPSEASTAPLIIKIPAANLVTSTSDLDVTSNENAVFAITTPITETLVPVSNLTGKTYTESAQEPTFGGTLTRDTDYTVSYALKSGSTGNLDSDNKPVGAGTYLVTVTGKGSYTGSFPKDFKIDKADPVYSQPTAKTGLAYTGSPLDLIDAGTMTKGGEMQYKLDGGSYSTTIPTAINAGDYTVYYQITGNNNYNEVSETKVGTGAINIAQVEWGTPTEALTPVNPATAGGSDGQITGTTSAMQYKKSDGTWTDCTGDVTGLAAGNYYVRYKADGNHTASDTHYKTVTLTDPGATLYGVTVTDGTAEPTGDQAAGTEVTITATTKTGFHFKEWTGLDGIYKTGFTKTSNPVTFIMPASDVSVKATYEAAALTGTASITGDLKFNEELTASLAGGNNTGTLTYKWYRSGETTAIATNTTGKYTLTEDDIGKTITVKISSDVQTGEITSPATGNIDKADGPAEPSVTPVACTSSSNNDGKIIGVNTTMEYSAVSDFATKTTCTGSEITGLVNGTYYVRVAETTTHKAGTAATVIVSAYTASGTSGGTSSGGFSGGGYVPTTQKPDIKAGEGGSIALSKDGTTATITPNAGMMIDKVMLNGKDMGALTVVKGIKTGDKLEVSFKQTAEEKAKMDKAVVEQVSKAGLTARSARTAKKNVKLVVKSDLEGITDAGYTVEYKFYRSTKKSAGYKAMKTGKSGIYINTYGKKGTLYYYKVKVMVYDKDGNLTAQSALKQCKYASRLWTK